MSLWRHLGRGFRVLFRRRAADEDLADEVEQYFEEATDELEAQGLTLEQARRAARLQLGTTTSVREQVREHGWEHTVDMLVADLRYGARRLRSSPGFAAAATLILALGIGANTGIFSLLNDIRLSALPVTNPHELVMLTNPGAAGKTVGRTTGERDLLSYPEFTLLRDQSTSFSGLMASQADLDAMQARVDGSEAEEIRTRMVSAEYFTTLGVSAALGRVFSEDARVQGAAPYAVISYDYWQRRLGGRADILGLTMAIRDGVFTIIGVAPRSFFGETVGQRPDVWLPLSMQATVLPGRDWLHDTPDDIAKVMWLHVFGRLKAGVTIERAQAETNTIFQRGLGAYYGGVALTPDDRKAFLDQRLRLRPAATGASQIRGPFSEPLLMLLAAAALVLLIACANLGNLLLARTAARNREISVRLALGAHRGRLVRQLLTESLLVALLGGIIGMLAALVLRSGLLRLVSDSIVLPMTPDVGVLGFTFTLTLAAGLMLGLLPALRATKTNAGAGLKEQGRGLTGSAAWLRLGKVVVVGQFAASLPLLVGAGLLVRAFTNLQRIDLGYPKDHLLMVRVDARTAGYGPLRRLALFEQLLDRFRVVPGVASGTYSQNGLFTEFDSGSEIVVEGYKPQGREDEGSSWDQVGPGYFSTLGVPILLGREILEQDQQARQEVCVINEAFVTQFFDGRHPLGMHITRVFADQRNTCLVVGVARDFQSRSIRGEIAPRLFLPAGSLEALTR